MNTEYTEKLKDKKILIVGLGRSGIAALKTMTELGAKTSIQDSKEEKDIDAELLRYIDENGIDKYFGRFPEDPAVFDMILLSPGVDPEKEYFVNAAKAGTEITGELEQAYRIASGNFAAITGTNGKTTTTTLVGEIFKLAGRRTEVVGNIGLPVISKAPEAAADEWLITETSSFQLQTAEEFKPKVSAFLNLTPDHLNRHHTMEIYGETKARIWANQTADDFAVINFDDDAVRKLAEKSNAKVMPFSRRRELGYGAFLKGDKLVIRDENGCLTEFFDRKDMKIIGDHNVENALAAAAICFCAGIEPEYIRDAILAFRGVEHRIEYVDEINGVRYYNDSKGTNTDAAEIALKAVGKNIILIAGGDGKGQNFDGFAEKLNGPVKHMILLGRDGGLIGDAAERAGFKAVTYAHDMKECVEIAHEMAEPGDSVLFSPACASWDMYKNFEIRGADFKNCVKALTKTEKQGL